MIYLNREERRKMMLNAAKKLALQAGFNALTVRCIAAEAQVSTGQVHHHFQSASHLKAEVFLELMDQLNEVEAQIETQSWHERVSVILGCENIKQVQPYLRLWNEAESLIDQDQEIGKAYNIAMERWHDALVHLIDQGIQQQEFAIPAASSKEDAAWRLIAFVCGLESICKLKLKNLDEEAFQTHMRIMIKMELFNHAPQ